MPDSPTLAALVVDPSQGMRNGLQAMLTQIGIARVALASNAAAAIHALRNRSFDLILCEYDLGGGGDGQDGQQLLEDLRHHALIGPDTVFIMLTSEAMHSKVVSAAELAPADYILKPFTAELLAQRVARALERRRVLLPVYRLIEQGKLAEAQRQCDEGAQAHPRHAAEFARLRAELFVQLKQWPQAEQAYRVIADERALAWAGLGVARAILNQGRLEQARDALAALVAAHPRLMTAYDLLARCHALLGDAAQARAVLADAVAISPHVVGRLRMLGEAALAADDAATAEQSFRQVVAKARHSEFRTPEDHLNLVKALVKKGAASQAGGVLRDLERSLRDHPALEVCKACAAALMHDAAGDTRAAAADLANAAEALKAATGLSSSLRMELAQSCLAHRLDDAAAEVMLTVVHDVKAEVTAEQAAELFQRAGRPDLARGMGERLAAHTRALLALADEKRHMGDVRGAVHSLQEALHVSPHSSEVQLALVGAIVRQIDELGWDHPLGELAHTQLRALQAQAGGHPRLPALEQAYAAARRKYGIATTA